MRSYGKVDNVSTRKLSHTVDVWRCRKNENENDQAAECILDQDKSIYYTGHSQLPTMTHVLKIKEQLQNPNIPI